MVINTQRDNNDASVLCLFIHYIQMHYPPVTVRCFMRSNRHLCFSYLLILSFIYIISDLIITML